MARYSSLAPGRLDVMGGIADYSGSLVLQWPIREATRVAVRPWRQRRFSITSLSGAGERTCDVPLDLVADATRPYEHAAAWFAADPARHWAAHVAGVFHVLAREHGVRFATGAAILIESDVPEGRGVSSSAAIEAATMEAACAAWHVSIDPTLRALRCQQVENLIVGAPCGVMDQMASICGEAESLMALLCQPAEFQGVSRCRNSSASGVSIRDPPRDHRSGLRRRARGRVHGLPDPGRTGRAPGRIGEARGARAGRRPALGRLSRQCRHPDVPSIRARDPRITERRCVPRPLSGNDGSRHSRDPSRTYAIRTPTAHPIHEHERVDEWAQQLRSTQSPDAARLGSLMYESHASYSACGLGSDGTDALVALARESGVARGIYGAKITGGGSGGTVAVLGRAEAAETVRAMPVSTPRRAAVRRTCSKEAPPAPPASVQSG